MTERTIAAIATADRGTASEPSADTANAGDPPPPPGRINDWPTPPGIQRGFRIVASLLALAGLALVARAFVVHLTRNGGGSVIENDLDWAWGIAGAVLAVLGGSAILLAPERSSAKRQIATAAVWSATLLAGLFALWWLIDSSARQDEWRGTPVQSQAEVDAFLADYPSQPPLAAADGEGGAEVRIPTGVMLQSVEFLSGANVRISGFIWQKYPVALPESVTRGFVLPDAIVEAYRADEAYRHSDGDTETIGWYVAATLRESFDYARYPFDRPDVWVRIWARDFDRNLLLVPDLDAYADLTPETMPGVEGTFVYGNWDPAYSGFSYDLGTFNADFGIPSDDTASPDPELHFNLVMKRDPLGPASDYIAYSLTVALLAFGLLALTSANPDIRGRFGISTAGVLGSVSVLLFGVISKQGSLRTALDTQQLTYLEALPLLLYVMLLLTALNAILVCAPFDFKALEYRDNLLPELLYWPVLLGLLFGITLVVFYA